MATSLTTYHPFDAGAGANSMEAQWRDMARHWLATGVLDGEDNEFAVAQRAAGANMSVDVATGKCWVRGHYGAQTSVVNQAIANGDATNPRKDRVILRADFANNRIEVDVLQGTPAGSPTVPTLTQSSTVWEIALATIQVDANEITSIVTADITDERTIVSNATSTDTVVIKTANESVTSSTAFQDDDALTFAVLNAKKYIGEFVLFVDGATAADIKFTVKVTASGGHWGQVSLPAAATTSTNDVLLRADAAFTDSGTTAATIASPTMTIVPFGFTASANGNCTLRWAQAVSDATATRILAGSYLRAREVA